MGQVLTAAEKLKLQTNAFQGQSSRKEKVSPTSHTSKDAISNRDQTQHQGSARTQSISSPERLHPPSTRRASSSLLSRKADPARTTIALKTNPSTLTLACFRFLLQLATWRGRNLAAKIWSLSRRSSKTAIRTCRNFSFTESRHLLRSPSRRY